MVVFVKLPDEAVTVTVTVPVAAVPLAVSVNVLVLAVLLGLNDAVTPLGRPDADKLTLPLKPFCGVTVMVLVPVVPCASVKLFGDSRHVRQTQVVRLHHDGDDGYRNTQPETPCCLLVDECPIAMPALCILFGLRGVIERELDVMEGTELIVFQNSNTMTIGSDGELDRFRSQVGKYRLEVGMHAVLTGAEIHRPYGQAFHDCLHLIQ